MYKGIGKQVVVIKKPDSKIFEEAIFVIKDGAITVQTDFLHECEKLIKSTGSFKTIKKSNSKNRILNILLYSGLLLNSISILIILFAVM